MFFDFLKILGTTLSIVWGFLISFLYFLSKSILLKEIFVGCSLPVVCFIPGFYAISWAVDRPFRPFIIAVFGGMFNTLSFYWHSFYIDSDTDQASCVQSLFSLVGFYTLCLVVELCFVKAKYNTDGEVQK